MTKTANSILAAALSYAAKSWMVFPAPPGSKKSYKSGKHNSGINWGMSRDQAQIKRDWRKWPDANVGLPTGPESGFWVCEADTMKGHGVDGIAALRALEAEHGQLPATLMAESPSGSIHYYWKWPDGDVITNSTSMVAPGVDVKGEGGMVIAPPSVRADGAYRWLNDFPIIDAPDWLLQLAINASRKRDNRTDKAHATNLAPDEIEQLSKALDDLPNDNLDWENWNRFGMAIYAATGGSSVGRGLFHTWSMKSNKYDAGATDDRWDHYHSHPPTDIGAGTIFYEAKPYQRNKPEGPGTPEDGGQHARYAPDGVSVDDFYAYMPQHNYICVPTREPWPAASVNARIPPFPVLDKSGQPVLDKTGKPKLLPANTWLDQNRPVEQMTWAPGEDMLIRDRLISEGDWIERKGVACFNLYRPPTIELGDATKAEPWLEHLHRLYGGDEAEHIIKRLAHRRQRPQDKINHALVFGSSKHGVGKDAAIEPAKRAIGPWNFQEVSPQQVLGRFNGFLKSVILRVNEARDLGDINRYQFYDHMKAYIAAPPEVLRVDEKNLREHNIINCVGVIITTNYKTNGIYLPAEDRRHFVAWSNRVPEDFGVDYWNKLFGWYEGGGDCQVAAYLATLDISSFDPKAAPPKTQAFWDIVEANRAPEDSELADVLDRLNNPPATTIALVIERANPEFARWLQDHRNRRQFPYRFEQCGYVPIRNPAEKRDGSWKIGNTRQTVYVKNDLSRRDQLAAATALARQHGTRHDQDLF